MTTLRASAVVLLLVVGAVGLPMTAVPASAAPADCRTIPVDADPVLRSDAARAAFGVDGTGVKIGIISDSFDVNPALSTAAQNVADGLLPGPGNPCGYSTPVQVVREMPATTSGTDEGRAMAQMVHGIAPGAELYFASAGEGLADFAGAIIALGDQDVDIILDDVIADDEPFYQQSEEATLVDLAVAELGVVYLSAAGNNTVVASAPLPGQEATPIGAWETTAYRPAVCDPSVPVPPIPAGFTGYDCLDVDPGTGVDTAAEFQVAPAGLVTEDGASTVDLELTMQWGEPFGAVTGRFEWIASVDGGPAQVLEPIADEAPLRRGTVTFDVPGSADPTDQTVDMAVSIVRYTDGTPATDITPPIGWLSTVDGLQWAASAEWWRSDGPDTVGRSIVGHNGAPSALTIAASGAFDDDRVEDYSSLGPATYFLEPEVNGPGALPLPEPVRDAKPDLLSVDGASQNVLEGAPTATPGVFLFNGTSAATPTAGGVVALALQLDPDLTPADIGEILAATATPIDSPYPTIAAENSVGAGLIDALALLEAIAGPPVPGGGGVLPVTGGTGDVTGLVTAAAGMLAAGAILLVARRRGHPRRAG